MTMNIFKLVCRLDSPSETEVLAAARALVRGVKAINSDLRTLADGMEAEYLKRQKFKPRPASSLDYSEVAPFIATYVEGKTSCK